MKQEWIRLWIVRQNKVQPEWKLILGQIQIAVMLGQIVLHVFPDSILMVHDRDRTSSEAAVRITQDIVQEDFLDHMPFWNYDQDSEEQID